MAPEIEAKFLDISPEDLRRRLRALGAERVRPEHPMRRKTFNPPIKAQDWVRVRDEGDRVTLAYKKLFDRSLHGTHEIETEVTDFDAACEILEASGLELAAYQETRREQWNIGEVEVVIDWWPWIPPLAEVEGPSEAAVQAVCRDLELDWSRALHGSVEVAYQAVYDVTEAEVNAWPEIVFSEVPEWLEKRRRES